MSGTGLRAMLRALGHEDRNERLSRLCAERLRESMARGLAQVGNGQVVRRDELLDES